MKIFKQIQIFIIFLFFVNLPLVSANWYNNHNERFDKVSNIRTIGVTMHAGATFCDEDSELDGHGVKGNYLPSWVPEHIKRLSRAPSYDGVNTPMRGDSPVYNTWDAPGSNGYYITQSRAISKRNDNISMICQMWDSTNPWLNKIDYHNGWTNKTTVELDVEAMDFGGAGLGDIEIQEINSKNGPNFSDLEHKTNWRNITNFSVQKIYDSKNKVIAKIRFNLPPTEGTAYKFRFRVKDKAGNVSKNADGTDWMEGKNIYKLDTVPPKLTNLVVDVDADNNGNPDNFGNNGNNGNNFNNNGNVTDGVRNFQAGDEKPIILTYKNTDGSPIKINYSSENNDNPNSWNNKETTTTQYKFKLDDEYTKIDNDRNSATNGRIVSLKLNKITDEAGNVTNLNQNFNFNVFANINKIKEVNNENNSSNKYIADGQKNYYNQKLTDIYSNAIISSSTIGRTITRYSQALENKMFLDQQKRSGTTSVYLNDNNSTNIKPLPFNNTEMNWGNQISTDGVYKLGVSVYTPTKNSYDNGSNGQISDIDARFSLSSWLIIRDNQTKIKSISQVRIKNFDINNPIYKPLFTSEFNGDIKDGGFIEGALQNNSIKIIKNSNSTINPSNQKFILIYSGSQTPVFDLHYDRSNSEKGLPASKFIPSAKTGFENNFSSPKNFRSFLKQKSDIVGDVSKLQLSSHFSYILDGKNIFYNSAIIGKSHYHDTNEEENTTQAGVKIIGVANDKNLKHLLTTQKSDNSVIFVKSTVSNEVHNSVTQSVSQAVRNMDLKDSGKTLSNISIPNGSGVKAGMVNSSGGKILYIEANGQNIELSNSGAFIVSGINTIVIRGGNLYINSDMYYSDDDNKSILGVVIQKDANLNGGNLYINPKVTNIVGTYVADGYAASYDGSSEISVGQINKLKNQLYIYGGLITHNTIGGSRNNPIICPLIVNCTNIDDAQKYDLNYLRRYYIYNKKPFGNGKIIGGATIDDSGKASGFDTKLKSKFDNINDDLAKHPVIIEFNQNIINNPPIGFDVFR